MSKSFASKYWFVFALSASASAAHAGDAFDGLQCGGDVGKTLAGKHIGNGSVAALEKRHAAIGLKHEGSEELAHSLDYEAWTICGSTYHFIVRKDVVADVVRADHSKTAPAFLGTCDENGAPTKYEVLAILKPDSADLERVASNGCVANRRWSGAIRRDESRQADVPARRHRDSRWRPIVHRVDFSPPGREKTTVG